MRKLTIEEAIKYLKEVVRKNRKNSEKNTIIIPNSFISSDDCAEKYEQVAEWLEELKAFKEAEEQGLLVRSPCKIGDKIYRVNARAKNPIIEMEIIQIEIRGILYSLKAIDKDGDELIYTSYSVGTTIFFNREEAEKKLEELKNGK